MSSKVVGNKFASVNKDQVLNSLITTKRNKVPRIKNLAQLGGTTGNAGQQGEIILNHSNRTFYGHTGKKWVPFGGWAAVTLANACGSGTSLVNKPDGPNIKIKGLVAGDNINFDGSTTDCVQINGIDQQVPNLNAVLNIGNDAGGESIEDTTGPLRLQTQTTPFNNGVVIGIEQPTLGSVTSGKTIINSGNSSQDAILLNAANGGTTILNNDDVSDTLLLRNTSSTVGGVHLITQQQTPPVLSNVTSPNISIVGASPGSTDTAGTICLLFGGSLVFNNYHTVTLTFNQQYSVPPIVLLTKIGTRQGVPFDLTGVTSTTTSGFTLELQTRVNAIFTEAEELKINYHVIGIKS